MIHHRKSLFVLSALLLVASMALVAFMLQPSAADLLTDSATALQQTAEGAQSGHAVVAVELDTPEKSGTATVEIWGKLGVGPEGEPAFRMEVLESSMPEMQGLVAVGDGTQLTLWQPAENRALVATAAEMKAYMEEKMAGREPGSMPEHSDQDHPQTAEEAVAELLTYFTAERAGSEALGETDAYKLRLVPIPEQMPDEVRAAGGLLYVWLRPSDSMPLGVEYTGGALGTGKAIATRLEVNVPLAEDLFTFTVPDGAEIVGLADLEPKALSLEEADAAAGFDVLSPAMLPEDAKLVEVLEMRGAIVQRYSLRGGGSFSVAQGPSGAAPLPEGEGQQVTVRGVEGLLFAGEDGARTLLTWTEGNTTFWIGGDLATDEAQSIADSLQ